LSERSTDATHRVECTCGRVRLVGDRSKSDYVDYDSIAESYAGAHEFTHEWRDEDVTTEVTRLAE